MIWIKFEWHPLVPTHDEVGCSPTTWGGLDRWPAFEIHGVILHKLWDLISSHINSLLLLVLFLQWVLLVHRIHSNPQINFVIRLILDISRHCGCNTKDLGSWWVIKLRPTTNEESAVKKKKEKRKRLISLTKIKSCRCSNQYCKNSGSQKTWNWD